MVATSKILALGCSVIVAIGLPVALLLWWHKRTKASWRDAAVGALVFFVFALVLEQLLHMVVWRTPVPTIPWAMILYGSFAAGVFEETGRYVGFRFLLKRQNRKEDAIMYGIGHGGLESVLISGLSLLVTLVVVLRSNAGAILSPAFQQTVAAVGAGDVPTLLAGGIERIIAIALHIALSVLVFQAVKRPGCVWLYPLAILLHAAVDSLAMLYRYQILSVPVMALEGLVALATLLVCLFAAWRYRHDAAGDASLHVGDGALQDR
ncbi:MAG: YhfC family intramembrane metalloprotease [Sphaerochaeta sp.]|jgi:uncharacterized membrane protein YhfC|nr:YhfC family intramembrane metalloprotease [Sphaerochaeta sp.]MCH3920563.1 YhfC family intramembrane metalloprotease [Sphaerochaeta sp.]MCI2076402.1 YhfC family intramembrane metalloprotease [Sphaerochaeta sp.]MCI2096598.1 YhfC family intramembrane metalloprotease [Sphaerochaeta sp.]MCI2103543.1 YhfC family intramembrane metalloprotease [Sphaerochaeta sp.]